MDIEDIENTYITSDLLLGENQERDERIFADIDNLPPNSKLLVLGNLYGDIRFFPFKKIKFGRKIELMVPQFYNNDIIIMNNGGKYCYEEIELHTRNWFKIREIRFSHEPIRVERPTDDISGFTGAFPPEINVHGLGMNIHGFIETPTCFYRYINVTYGECKFFPLPKILKAGQELQLKYIKEAICRIKF